MNTFDIAVIGAGHAGIEAALSAARLGLKVILFTINMDAVGNMPCNPSIGGTAKGHLVREIDALGGEMGKAADRIFLQNRMLNRGKGPAVHSLRIQADRREYQKIMKYTLEKQENLTLKQAEITEIKLTDGKVSSVITHLGAEFNVKAAIICSGTYLQGRIIVGPVSYSGGPDGSASPAAALRSGARTPTARRRTACRPRTGSRTAASPGCGVTSPAGAPRPAAPEQSPIPPRRPPRAAVRSAA